MLKGYGSKVQADGLNVLSQNTVASSLIRLTQEMPHAQADDYNTYHRSPRIIHREPTDDIKIERPPQPIQKNNDSDMAFHYTAISNDCFNCCHLFSETNWYLYFNDDWYEYSNDSIWYYNVFL